LKEKLEEGEKQRTEAQARADKKEGDLCKSIETLLGKLLQLSLFLFTFQIALIFFVYLHIVLGAIDMPIHRSNRLRVDSMPNAISFAIYSIDQIQELLK
jgi:hypothetical protein